MIKKKKQLVIKATTIKIIQEYLDKGYKVVNSVSNTIGVSSMYSSNRIEKNGDTIFILEK